MNGERQWLEKREYSRISKLNLQEIGQFSSAGSTEGKAGAVVQDDAVFTMEPGLEFFYSIQVHDCRPVNPYKLLWIKLAFKSTDRLTMQKRFLCRMKADVLALGFDPIDIGGLDKQDARV